MKKEYSFYCIKCKSIPLIELNPKESQLNILTTCKCHKQYLNSEIFYKNYYKEISFLKEKEENININITINKLIENYLKHKEIFKTKCEEIKNNTIDILKKAIKKIESFYEENNEINIKIDKIIQKLIDNYKSNPNNKNNIKNIILNTQINEHSFIKVKDNFLNQLFKNINDFFKNNFIINSYKLKLLNKYNESNTTKIFIEIGDDLFAKTINDSIEIFDYKNNFENTLVNLSKINNLLIDENKKYLISLDKNYSIKFWDIEDIKNKFNDIKNIMIPPIYQYEEQDFVDEIVYIEKNILLLSNNENLFIYEYNINEKSFKEVKRLKMKSVKNYKIIKRKNKINICCVDKKSLVLIDYPELKIIDNIEIFNKYYHLKYYEQINNDEIIIGESHFLKIFNLNKKRITLIKRINFEVTCFKILKDNTLLVGGRSEIKRFFLKTMQELPQLIILENKYFNSSSDDESIGFLPDLDRDMKDVKSIYQLPNGKIIIVMNYYIEIYGLDRYIDIDNKI